MIANKKHIITNINSGNIVFIAINMLLFVAYNFCYAQENTNHTTLRSEVTYTTYNLSLEECKVLAIKNNSTLKNAELDIEQAKLTQKAASTKYFPQVNAIGAGFYSNNPLIDMNINDIDLDVRFNSSRLNQTFHTLYNVYGPYIDLPVINAQTLQSGFVGSITAMQPVYMGGRIVNGNKLANLGVQATEIQKDILEKEILVKTEEFYFTILSLQEKLKLVEVAQNFLDTLYKDASLAVNAGIIHSNDLLKINLKKSEILSNELKLKNGILLAKYALYQHIGLNFDENITLSDTLSDINDMMLVSSDFSEAVKSRKEFKLLNLSVEAEGLKKKMLVGEVLPQIIVGVGYTCNTLMHKLNTNGLVFGSLVIPITNWWEKSYDIKKQNLACDKAANQQKTLTEQMVLQMQMCANELNEAIAQLQLSQQTISMAEENLKLQLDNYKAGYISVSSVLEAQTILQEAKSQNADAKVNYLLKLSKYKQYTE